MDNEQLLDKVQNLLLGLEDRTNTRFQDLEDRLSGRFHDLEDRLNSRMDSLEDRLTGRMDSLEDRLSRRMDTLDLKIESVRAEVKLHNELLAPFIHWSHRIEDEVIRLSAALQDLQTRLAKLENPPAH
jgi:chromosome segregation ATPase